MSDEIREGRFANYNMVDIYRKKWTRAWVCLDRFALLRDDLVIAASEVGLPCAMNPHKVIVDLAGLNERDFAHRGFSADMLFGRYRPDVIYMPHGHYRDMREQIGTHPDFAAGYDYFPGSVLMTGMGLAIRRDSEFYPVLMKILRESIPQWISWDGFRERS